MCNGRKQLEHDWREKSRSIGQPRSPVRMANKKIVDDYGDKTRPNGKPNILILWGDDIGWFNISHNNRGVMGYQTPNIDRLAREGIEFTDYYG
jgi:hypothetical protein